MEAGILICAVVAPLLVRADAIVPAQNAVLVRGVAVLMAAAWAVLALQHGVGWIRHALRRLTRSPAVLGAVGVAVTTLVATAFSVSPAISWWGSLNRRDGGFTSLAYLVIFASAGYCMRRRDQIVRLVDLIALTSLPIAFYALLQRASADPLPWAVDVTSRLASTLANPDFLGAWLILAMPVSAWGLYLAAGQEHPRSWGRVGVYAAALLLQAIVLDFTAARGATLGLAAGLAVAAVAVAAAAGRRPAARIGLASILIGCGVLVLLNLPIATLEPIRGLPGVSRFAHVLDSSDGSSQVRLLLWRASLRLLGDHPPLADAEGRADWPWAFRDAVGYGPESTIIVSEAAAPPELAHFERPLKQWDRAHNETFDRLLTRGALGLAAFLALFGALLWRAIGGLGYGGGSSFAVFAWLYAIGGLAGAAVSLLLQPVFLGLALPFGCLLGFLVYLALTPPARRIPNSWRSWLVVALLSALVGHFVEIQFGIEVLPTAVGFWTYAGLLLACTSVETPLDAQGIGARGAPSAALPAAAVTLCAVMVGADFLVWPSDAHSIPTALEISLTRGSGAAPSVGILETLLLVFLAGILLWSGGNERRTSLLVVLPPVAWLAFACGRLWFLQPEQGVALAGRLARLAAGALSVPVALLVLLAALGAGCASVRPGRGHGRRRAVLAAPAVAVIAVAAAFLSTGRQVQAEVLARFGNTAVRSAQVAVPAYAAAAALAPFDAYTHMLLGDAELARGDEAAGRAELRVASQLNPFDPSPDASLALHAQNTGSIEDADRHWAVVSALRPERPDTWLEAAAIKVRLADYGSALAFLQRAFELDPEFEQTYDSPATWPNNEVQLAGALRTYESSAAAATFEGRLVAGSVNAVLRRWPAAVDAYQAALALLPGDVDAWAIHRALAACYKGLGDALNADVERARALELARPVYPVSDLSAPTTGEDGGTTGS